VADRDWESDAERNAGVPDASIRDQCPDIASQLIDDYDNRKIRVLLGGGRRSFYPNSSVDPEYLNQKGKRQDSRNLVNVSGVKVLNSHAESHEYPTPTATR
jgi:alkaline phosphatase